MDDDGFAQFWAAYPRKVAKKDALRAWEQLRPSRELRETLLAAIQQQLASDQWQNPQYIPYPATWLRGERWLDQLSTRRVSQRVSRLARAVQEFVGSSSTVPSSPKSLPGSRSR